MNIYVASSWRNAIQPTVVEYLRKWGHEVYARALISSGGRLL